MTDASRLNQQGADVVDLTHKLRERHLEIDTVEGQRKVAGRLGTVDRVGAVSLSSSSERSRNFVKVFLEI